MGKITKVRPYKHYTYGEAIQIIADGLTEMAGMELIPTQKGDELVAIPSAEVRKEIDRMKRNRERIGPTAEDFIYRISKDRELNNLPPIQEEAPRVKTTEEIERILMERAKQQIESEQRRNSDEEYER